MSFSFDCPSCSAKLTAKDKHVGRELRCPKCKEQLVVPPPQPDLSVLEDADLQAFDPLNGDIGQLDFSNAGLESFGQSGGEHSLGQVTSLPSPYAQPLPSPYSQPTKPTKKDERVAEERVTDRKVLVLVAGAGVAVCLLLAITLGIGLLLFSYSKPGQVTEAAAPQVEQASGPSAAPPVSPSASSTKRSKRSSPRKASKASEAALGPLVRIKQDEAGQLTAEFATWEGKPIGERRLRDGEGIPLIQLHSGAEHYRQRWTVTEPAERNLLLSVEQSQHYSTFKLRPFYDIAGLSNVRDDTPADFLASDRADSLRIYDGVWSDDGHTLYLLTIHSRLMKIDTKTWEIQRVVHVGSMNQIHDIGLSSQGLVVLQDAQRIQLPFRDRERHHWSVITHPVSPIDVAKPALLLVDPDTLELINAWHAEEKSLAASPHSDVVYLASPGLTRVVNVASGEMLNSVPMETDKEAAAVLTPDAMSLLWCSLLPIAPTSFESKAAIHRYDVSDSGVRMTLAESNTNEGFASRDGQFFVVPQESDTFRTADTFASNFGYELFRTSALNEPVGQIEAGLGRGNIAFGGGAVFVEYPAGVDYESSNALRILQGTSKIDVDLGNRRCLSLAAEPNGRGVLTARPQAMEWIELKEIANTESFDSTDDLVARPSELKSDVYDLNGGLLPYMDPSWLGWSPDGQSFYVQVGERWDLVRFTDRQPNRFLGLPGIEGRERPNLFVTAAGIVVDHAPSKKSFLLDLETLQPKWEMSTRHATRLVGSEFHGRLAAIHRSGELRILDAPSGNTLATLPGEDLMKLPGASDQGDSTPALAYLPDGERILYFYGRRLAVLRINNNTLEAEMISETLPGWTGPPAYLHAQCNHAGTHFSAFGKVFHLNDLQATPISVGALNATAVIHFGRSGLLFAANADNQCLVFNRDGKAVHSVFGKYVSPSPQDSTQFITSTNGTIYTNVYEPK